MRSLTLALCLMPLTLSCTIIAGDVTPSVCTANADCEPLNEQQLFHDVDQCNRWVCTANTGEEGKCVFRDLRDQDELCDGADNDCDGNIDEAVLAPSETAIVESVTDSVVLTQVPGGVLAAWEGGYVEFDLPAEVHAEELTWHSTRYETSDSLRATTADVEDGCRSYLPDAASRDMCVASTCTLGQMPTACSPTVPAAHRAGDFGYVAAIDQGGCAVGRLRIGHFSNDDARTMARGPLRRSNSAYGVDLAGPTLACSGVDGAGARAPSVASLDTDRQALVAWVGASAVPPACSLAPAPLNVVVAHRLEGAWMGRGDVFTTVSNEGMAQPLGMTTSGERPAVAAVSSAGLSGFVVGFADQAGQLALAFVPSQPAPPNPLPDASSTPNSYDELPNARPADIAAPPIAGIVDLGTITATNASVVEMATGRITSTSIELGVAWREGCSGDTSVHFAHAVADLTTGTLTDITEQILDDSAGDKSAPSLTWLARGFATVGATRADGRSIADGEAGGWWVGWVTEPRDSGAAVHLSAMAADGRAWSTTAYPSVAAPGAIEASVYRDATGSRARVAWATADSLVARTLSCAAE